MMKSVMAAAKKLTAGRWAIRRAIKSFDAHKPFVQSVKFFYEIFEEACAMCGLLRSRSYPNTDESKVTAA
ncbi:hypothetical protein C8R48DRAFT_700794, partial [Suillus tomentosus]